MEAVKQFDPDTLDTPLGAFAAQFDTSVFKRKMQQFVAEREGATHGPCLHGERTAGPNLSYGTTKFWQVLKRRWLLVLIPAARRAALGLLTYEPPAPAYNTGVRFIVGQTPAPRHGPER